ncbi:MAG: M28 family peptidase [Acidobacteriota bacterium]|nr:M28 family peptidase [Acidobacteriota bacterium]
MRRTVPLLASLVSILPFAAAQAPSASAPAGQVSASGVPIVAPEKPDPDITAMVERLDLVKYKDTIEALTQFGDRRQGTERNRKALDWIESQLKSYGCANTERVKYDYTPPGRGGSGQVGSGRGGSEAGRGGAGGAGAAPATDVNAAPGRGGRGGTQGGGRPRGIRARTGVNNDPAKQPDEKLRALDSEPSKPGPREEIYCTKIGATHPGEMYIVAAHMDGMGYGEAANDDGSGTALVMEIARVLSSPDVQTDRSIRFALWNNEESGLNGARAYVAQRKDLQGREDPPGSGKYPEPKWLGMIQHDMMLFDHGMPLPDGTLPKEQRPEADVNVEFQRTSKKAAEAAALGWAFVEANEKYAANYPAALSNHMTNTDSTPFMDLVPAISLRENQRGPQTGNGWDPHWHQPTDLFATFSDDDFRLGLNATQTTLGAVATLAGARLVK